MATEPDVLAALQVLVAVAKADGKLEPEELGALESALEEHPPTSLNVARLLAEPVDLDAALAGVASDDVRRQTFAAAAAMASADKHVAPEERALLDRIQAAWRIPDEVAALSERLATYVDKPEEPAPPPAPAAIDPAKAEAEAKRLTYGYAIGTIALGAFPIPGVSIVADVLTIVVQRRLISQVAKAHGKALTNAEVAAAYGAMAGLAAVRVAVVSVMKLIPVWGWVVGGASAFVTTWGVGMAVHTNLARGGSLSAAELKADFEAAKAEGKRHFHENKASIEADARARSETIARLARDANDGKISRQELEDTIASLG